MPVATGDIREIIGQPVFIPLFKLYKVYGPIFRLSFGPKNFVIVSDPQITKQVCAVAFREVGSGGAHVDVVSVRSCAGWSAVAGCTSVRGYAVSERAGCARLASAHGRHGAALAAPTNCACAACCFPDPDDQCWGVQQGPAVGDSGVCDGHGPHPRGRPDLAHAPPRDCALAAQEVHRGHGGWWAGGSTLLLSVCLLLATPRCELPLGVCVLAARCCGAQAPCPAHVNLQGPTLPGSQVDLFGDCTLRGTHVLEAAAAEGRSVEMENFFSRYALDIIGKVGGRVHTCNQGVSVFGWWWRWNLEVGGVGVFVLLLFNVCALVMEVTSSRTTPVPPANGVCKCIVLRFVVEGSSSRTMRLSSGWQVWACVSCCGGWVNGAPDCWRLQGSHPSNAAWVLSYSSVHWMKHIRALLPSAPPHLAGDPPAPARPALPTTHAPNPCCCTAGGVQLRIRLAQEG